MAAFGQAAPPDWFDGSSVDEIAFSEYVLYKHPMRCIHDRLYDIDGLLSDAAVQSEILEYVRPYVKSNVAKNVEKYLNALKLAAYCPELPTQEDRIHFQNGTYFIEDRRFTPEKEFCLNRLPVRFNPEAPEPVRWKKFLDELLYPEDIPTLQEFMGYTLLPSNKGQKMMIIIGNGGEGKSRIGRVLRAILGDNMNTTAIDKLSKDKFCRADQEGKLLMLDDDMKLQALDDTNILKAIITMEDKMDLERKNMQSYQGFLYVRLLGLGNGSLSALQTDASSLHRELNLLMARNQEIDDTFLSLYTDKSKGILTEQRFLKLTVAMENEQKENNGRIAEIQALLRDSIDQESDIRQFITEIRQCEAITELDEGILNHLIDKIMIGDVKKVNGEKVQEVRFFYNFVGEVAEMAA